MRFKKLKEKYIEATTLDMINDACVEDVLEQLERDGDMSKEKRIEYVRQLKQGIENRENLAIVKTRYKVRKAERDTQLYTTIGAVIGVVIGEYGPLLVKHFRNK